MNNLITDLNIREYKEVSGGDREMHVPDDYYSIIKGVGMILFAEASIIAFGYTMGKHYDKKIQ